MARTTRYDYSPVMASVDSEMERPIVCVKCPSGRLSGFVDLRGEVPVAGWTKAGGWTPEHEAIFARVVSDVLDDWGRIVSIEEAGRGVRRVTAEYEN